MVHLVFSLTFTVVCKIIFRLEAIVQGQTTQCSHLARYQESTEL
jgi:hypothetical protein